MRPYRAVVNTYHRMAFLLECGHTVYRQPLQHGRAIIPKRVQCEECERGSLQSFEVKLAKEEGRAILAARICELLLHAPNEGSIRLVRKILDLCKTKVFNANSTDSVETPDDGKKNS
jgi:hypothetical protein